ncbi:hypothetical protein Tco_0261380 [Tanacetum coccineum]
MATLKFADTHNKVAFLSKPTESDGSGLQPWPKLSMGKHSYIPCLKSLSSQQSQDKGKGILIEPVKKKDQILLDEETALNLQAEFDEEERLAREKAEKEQEANIALVETWDDIQAKIDVDHQLADRRVVY